MATIVGAPCPSLPVMSLADDSVSTIAELAGGKMALVDFWTTKCVRCPMAIQKLEMAAANPKYADTVKFFTICCDAADVAKEIVEEEEWENMTHTFMALDKKEECKEYFGFTSVPHYVLINKAGVVVHNVSTKFELSTLDELVAADDSVAATPTKAAAASAVSPAAESPSSPLAPLEIDVGVEAAAAPDQSEMSEAEKQEVNRLRNENEAMRKRLTELSMSMNDNGDMSSPTGYGSNPLSVAAPKEDEPLLQDNPGRFVIFPIGEHSIWGMYKKAEANVWTAEEVDLTKEGADWANLSADEQDFVSHMLPPLCFLSASCENQVELFATEVQVAEARFFYGFQIALENIHSEMYSLLIDTYVKGEAEKQNLFNSVQAMPAVQRKAAWSKQIVGSTSSFGHRLLQFVALEGLFFSGSFCAAHWLKTKGLLNGLTEANELISRDEHMHCEFACTLYKMLHSKPTELVVQKIIADAVEIEKEYMAASGVEKIGMDSAEMSKYIEFKADRLLADLGHEKSYNTDNPYQWMEQHTAAAASTTTMKAAPVSPVAEMAAFGGGGPGLSFDMDDDF